MGAPKRHQMDNWAPKSFLKIELIECGAGLGLYRDSYFESQIKGMVFIISFESLYPFKCTIMGNLCGTQSYMRMLQTPSNSYSQRQWTQYLHWPQLLLNTAVCPMSCWANLSTLFPWHNLLATLISLLLDHLKCAKLLNREPCAMWHWSCTWIGRVTSLKKW